VSGWVVPKERYSGGRDGVSASFLRLVETFVTRGVGS
jgi:hypothetical protein